MFRICWNSESPGNKACLLTISAAQKNKFNYIPSYIKKEKYQNHQHKELLQLDALNLIPRVTYLEGKPALLRKKETDVAQPTQEINPITSVVNRRSQKTIVCSNYITRYCASIAAIRQHFTRNNASCNNSTATF